MGAKSSKSRECRERSSAPLSNGSNGHQQQHVSDVVEEELPAPPQFVLQHLEEVHHAYRNHFQKVLSLGSIADPPHVPIATSSCKASATLALPFRISLSIVNLNTEQILCHLQHGRVVQHLHPQQRSDIHHALSLWTMTMDAGRSS